MTKIGATNWFCFCSVKFKVLQLYVPACGLYRYMLITSQIAFTVVCQVA